MGTQELAEKIYEDLNKKGANLGNVSLLIIKNSLDKNLIECSEKTSSEIMWKYQKLVKQITDPNDYEILSEMDRLGEDGWEIFSIIEKVVEEWKTYGETHKVIEYTMYMKKKINIMSKYEDEIKVNVEIKKLSKWILLIRK